MRQDIQINELRRQKQGLEASLHSLKQSANNHNTKLKVMRDDYQQKLETLAQQVLFFVPVACIVALLASTSQMRPLSGGADAANEHGLSDWDNG